MFYKSNIHSFCLYIYFTAESKGIREHINKNQLANKIFIIIKLRILSLTISNLYNIAYFIF